MYISKEEYVTAIRSMYRETNRLRGKIKDFMNADIGGELWGATRVGSKVVAKMQALNEANNVFIEELEKMGVIRRDNLYKEDRAVNSALRLLGIEPILVSISPIHSDRISSVVVAYPKDSGLNFDRIETLVVVTNSKLLVNGRVYAHDLKVALEEQGLYGIAIQDSRDDKVDALLAGVIAKGRLLTHARREAGLPRKFSAAKWRKKRKED